VSKASQKKMVWWNLPVPPHRNTTFAELIEDNPTSVNCTRPKNEIRSSE